MSSAGTIAGLSPWALLGVKGAGLGRRGGVPGAWPFMAAGASTAFGVETGSSLPRSPRVGRAGAVACRLQYRAGALQKHLLALQLGLLAARLERQRCAKSWWFASVLPPLVIRGLGSFFRLPCAQTTALTSLVQALRGENARITDRHARNAR